MSAGAGPAGTSRAQDAIVERLTRRFPSLPASTVRTCVEELWACCGHVGVAQSPATVERLAESRLTGIERGARTGPAATHPAAGAGGIKEWIG